MLLIQLVYKQNVTRIEKCSLYLLVLKISHLLNCKETFITFIWNDGRKKFVYLNLYPYLFLNTFAYEVRVHWREGTFSGSTKSSVLDYPGYETALFCT